MPENTGGPKRVEKESTLASLMRRSLQKDQGVVFIGQKVTGVFRGLQLASVELLADSLWDDARWSRPVAGSEAPSADARTFRRLRAASIKYARAVRPAVRWNSIAARMQPGVLVLIVLGLIAIPVAVVIVRRRR